MPLFPPVRTWLRGLSVVNRARKLRRTKDRLQLLRAELERLARHHAVIVEGYGAAIQGLTQGLLHQEAELTALNAAHADTLANLQRQLDRIAGPARDRRLAGAP